MAEAMVPSTQFDEKNTLDGTIRLMKTFCIVLLALPRRFLGSLISPLR